MSLEQQYYDMITRMDHPVFEKSFEDVAQFDSTTPFNHVLNLLVAKQFVRMRSAKQRVIDNSLPHTTTASAIDRWEEEYFGFTKPQVPFLQRRNELVARYNDDISMSVPDVIKVAQQITGLTPVVIRNTFAFGWTLGHPQYSILGSTTVLRSTNQSTDAQLYIVIFSEPVDSTLLKKLDEELTLIEKAGSRHQIVAPPKFWILGVNTLGTDTILG